MRLPSCVDADDDDDDDEDEAGVLALTHYFYLRKFEFLWQNDTCYYYYLKLLLFYHFHNVRIIYGINFLISHFFLYIFKLFGLSHDELSGNGALKMRLLSWLLSRFAGFLFQCCFAHS